MAWCDGWTGDLNRKGECARCGRPTQSPWCAAEGGSVCDDCPPRGEMAKLARSYGQFERGKASPEVTAAMGGPRGSAWLGGKRKMEEGGSFSGEFFS